MKARFGAVALVLVAACGGDAGGGGSRDAPGGGGDAGGSAPCGLPDDACPTCQPCRYDQEDVSSVAAEDIAIHVGQHVDVVTLTRDDEVRVARRSGPDVWTDELVATAADASLVDIAATDDGAARWVAVLVGTGPLRVYASDGGPWTEETVPATSVVWAAIDVDAAGQPLVAFNGFADGAQGVFLAARAGGTWEPALVREGGTGRVAVVAADPVRIAWRDMAAQTVGIAVQTPAGFDVEPIQAELGAPVIASVDLAVDADGTPHVVYSRASRYVMHARKVGGSWTTSEVSSAFYSDTDASVAVGAGGAVHVGYQYGGLGIGVGDLAPGGFTRQPIARGCTESTELVDLASDAAGALHVAYRCEGRARYATRTGARYPDGYWDSCTEAAAALCARACSCGACCLESPGGSSQCTTPESSCRGDAVVGLCGDASLDPSAIEACAAVAPSAACGVDGVALPAECAAGF